MEPSPIGFELGAEKEIHNDVGRRNAVLRRVLLTRKLVVTGVHLGRRLEQMNWMTFA